VEEEPAKGEKTQGWIGEKNQPKKTKEGEEERLLKTEVNQFDGRGLRRPTGVTKKGAKDIRRKRVFLETGEPKPSGSPGVEPTPQPMGSSWGGRDTGSKPAKCKDRNHLGGGA